MSVREEQKGGPKSTKLRQGGRSALERATRRTSSCMSYDLVDAGRYNTFENEVEEGGGEDGLWPRELVQIQKEKPHYQGQDMT